MKEEETLYMKEQLKKVWHMHPKNWSRNKIHIVWDFINRAAADERFCNECICEEGYETTREDRDFPIFLSRARIIMDHLRVAIEHKRVCDLPIHRTGDLVKAYFMAMEPCKSHPKSRVYGIVLSGKEFTLISMQENKTINGHIKNTVERNQTAKILNPGLTVKTITTDVTMLLPERS